MLTNLTRGILAVLLAGTVWAEPSAPPGEAAVTTAAQAEVEAESAKSEFWIGVLCVPLEPQLREEMEIEEGVGLRVEEVAPGGPAAKAGVKPRDVLIAAGDQPLREIADLVEAIQRAKESPLALQVVREGESKTIKAIPAPRPESPRRPPVAGQSPSEWIEQMWPGEGGRPTMRFRFYHPGAIVPHAGPMHAPLPPGVSVTIAKTGDQPARITVERGNDRWEVGENELEKLPPDLRPHVEMMLGPAARLRLGQDIMGFSPVMPTPPIPGESARPSRDREGQPPARVEEMLRRMNQQIEELNRKVEAIQRQPEEKAKDRGPAKPKQKKESAEF